MAYQQQGTEPASAQLHQTHVQLNFVHISGVPVTTNGGISSPNGTVQHYTCMTIFSTAQDTTNFIQTASTDTLGQEIINPANEPGRDVNIPMDIADDEEVMHIDAPESEHTVNEPDFDVDMPSDIDDGDEEPMNIGAILTSSLS